MANEPQSGTPGRTNSPLVVGLDVGTTSVKALVVDEDGAVVSRSRLPSGLSIGPGGRFEHDAGRTWWEGPRAALSRAVTPLAGRGPSAVAVSAMMPSVAAVGPSGEPLGPGLLYGDKRAAHDEAEGGAQPEDGRDPTATGEMARLASWAASQQPLARGFWPAQAVANASLGGEGVIDLASAFASGTLFNGSGWDAVSCAAAGVLPGHLPRVAMFGEAVGHVPAALAGPGPAGDVVLGAGSVDGMCEQLVSGAVNDGDVLVALGSTLVVWLVVPGWPDEVAGLWRVPHIAAGKAMVGGASNAGGMWVDWADRVLRPAEEASRPWEIPIWWPWGRGERVPWHDPSLRVGLAGADLSHSAADLRRAALEASGFVVRDIVERAAGTGVRPLRYIASGGGSSRWDWLQAISEVLGSAVVPMAVPEGAALGAAFLARISAGLEAGTDDAVRWASWSTACEPRPEWAQAAGERYRLWSEALPRRYLAGPPGMPA